jgi:vancomycin permeability regulator SanA
VKRARLVVLVLVALLVGYPAFLGWRIWRQSRVDEVRGADAIVVLGAAQYNGDPSPVFRARLDHAVYLYNEGLSDIIVVTGGKAEGDQFTESDAGADYLVSQGIPESSLRRGAEGRTTLQSLEGVRQIATREGIDTLLLVSDPLHSERIKTMALDLGFSEAYASWASYEELNRSRATKVRELLHEIGALAAYQILNR